MPEEVETYTALDKLLFHCQNTYWVGLLTLRAKVISPGWLVHTGEVYVSARYHRFKTHDEGRARTWIWLRTLTLHRHFVHRSTETRGTIYVGKLYVVGVAMANSMSYIDQLASWGRVALFRQSRLLVFRISNLL